MTIIQALRTDASVPLAPREQAAAGPRERLLSGLPVAQRRLTLNGWSTAVLEAGDGAPLVLLHGPGEYAAKWAAVLPQLAETHHVIAPDLPGHGDSQPVPGGSVDVEQILDWMARLIERTCAAPPVLVGHLLGGAIATRFAVAQPQRLRALVLVDALGLAPFEPAPEFGQALNRFLTEPGGQTHDELWRQCAFDLDALRQRMGDQWPSVKEYNLQLAREPHLGATQRALMAQFAFQPATPQELARISVPTTLIWGRHDRAIRLAVAEAASTRFGWPLHVIEQAGDDPALEQPEAFLQALHAAALESAAGSVPDQAADSRAEWDRIAAGYDRTNTPTQMAIAATGLSMAGLQPGMSLLDVAAGSGALSIPAARMGARVTAIDQSSAMLELLAARAHSEELQVQTRVMDGHALRFSDASFDIAGSQFGVMLFPRMPAAIREMARVVRPGGRVLIHAYGDPAQIEFIRFLVAAVQCVRPGFEGPPQDPPPLEFQLADPQRLRAELSAAGLKDVRVETVIETTEHASGQALWDWLVSSNPIVEHLLGGMLQLNGQERQLVQHALDKQVRERAAGATTAKLTNPVNIGIGTR